MIAAAIAASAGLFAATSSANAAAYTFTTIQVPDMNTVALGINDAGPIVGSTVTERAAMVPSISYGAFSTIDAPGAIFTYANGINDAGQIVGTFIDNTDTFMFSPRNY
jgi:uncharacterized membrane protein